MIPSSRSSCGDLAIFRRYRALTVAQYHALVCPDRSRKLAEKKLAELREAGLVASHPLRRNAVYYTPTQRGASQLGLPRVKPMGAHAVIRHITAAALAIHLGTRISPKVETRALGQMLFQAEWPSGVPSAYCYPEMVDGKATLNIPVFDYGKNPRRLQKLVEKISRRLEAYPVAMQLMKEGRFRLVIVTGTETKAKEIGRLSFPFDVPIITLPTLGDMLRG